MIETYRVIGKIEKQRQGFSTMSSPEQKRFILMQYCSDLEDFTKTDKNGQQTIGRLLVLNIDTKSKKCNFSLGEQLTPDRSQDVMLFYKKAPGDPNIYATTNSLYGIVVWDLAKFLKQNFKDIAWSDRQLAQQFLNFVEKISADFYLQTDFGVILKSSVLENDRKSGFPDPEQDDTFKKAAKKAALSDLIKTQLDEYAKTTLKDIYDKNQGYAIKVDREYLHEGQYGQVYLEYLYYFLIEKNYIKAGVSGFCHVCHKQLPLGDKVSLKQKFYGTTNNLFFDGLKNNRTYTSFGMCAECNADVTIGSNRVINQMRYYILNISAYVFPSVSISNVADVELIDSANLSAVENILSPSGREQRDIDTQISILRRLAQKTGSFNILFFNTDPVKKDFKVIGFIRDASFNDLIEKSADLKKKVGEWKLYTIGKGMDLSLKGLRMLIVPSKRSHKIKSDGEFSIVGRRIVSLVEKYLYGRQFDYHDIIRSFVDIWSRIEYDNQDTYLDHELAALMLHLYLHHLNKFGQLKGVRTMQNDQMATSLDEKQHESILEFFRVNDHVYGKNKFYRGLFIMGVLISAIEAEEYKKTNKKTFSNRLNFRGISPRKVHGLYDLIMEYCKIREVYDDVRLKAYCAEALTGIETSNLLPEEVVYYILTGKSFSTYQSIIYSKQNKDKVEEKNDQQ